MFPQVFRVANLKPSRLGSAQHDWQRRNIATRKNVLLDERAVPVIWACHHAFADGLIEENATRLERAMRGTEVIWQLFAPDMLGSLVYVGGMALGLVSNLRRSPLAVEAHHGIKARATQMPETRNMSPLRPR